MTTTPPGLCDHRDAPSGTSSAVAASRFVATAGVGGTSQEELVTDSSFLDTPVVETTAGPVSGIAHSDGAAYLSVPFAAPPTGARRFLAPQHRLQQFDGGDVGEPGDGHAHQLVRGAAQLQGGADPYPGVVQQPQPLARRL